MAWIRKTPIKGEYDIGGIQVRPVPITPSGWANLIGLYKLLMIVLLIVMLGG